MLARVLVLALVALASAQRTPPLIPLPITEDTTTATTEAPKEVPKNATYWATCASKIIKGQSLDFQVAILKGQAPVTVTVSLLNYDGNKTILTQSQSVLPGDPVTISLYIPYDLERPSPNKYIYNYKIRVVGEGSEVSFKEENSVQLLRKALTIFVQTDKAIYKPGQNVKFRVMALTPDLKAVTSPMDIIVKDPKKNRIFQKKGLTDPTGFGVVEQSLQLASRVPQGQWKIEVSVQGEEEEQFFDVKQYRLPKFEVEIDMPPFGVTTDKVIPVTVKAKYTFGEPVTEGTVRVQMKRRYGQNTNNPFRRGQLNSKGEFTVQFTAEELLNFLKASNKYITSLNYQNVQIEATVMDSNTKRKQDAEPVFFVFYPTPMNINFLEISPRSFKSGLGYTGYLEVRKRDETLFSPEESSRIQIRVNITYEVPLPASEVDAIQTTPRPPRPILRRDPEGPSLESSLLSRASRSIVPYPPPGPYRQYETKILDIVNETLPSTGWITLNFAVPENATSITMNAVVVGYESHNTAYKRLSPTHSPTDSFLQLLIPPRKFRVGDILPVTATSTDLLTQLHLQFYSKSLLVDEKTYKLGVPDTQLAIDVPLTQAMSPSLKIVAFYFREDNSEVVVDALTLNVDGIFAKNVSVEFSNTKVKPGDSVDVKVKAEPGSRVYLLSNDKSVLLLKKGNDLTQEMVQTALITYDYGYWQPWMRYMVICGWPSYYGGTDAKETFSGAGVKMMTDGLVYRSPQTLGPVWELQFSRVLTASGQDAGDQSRRGGSGQAPDTGRVRKLFPENWLWMDETLQGTANELAIPTTAPDTVTTWVTTVFSMHPVYGLSVAAEPAELTTFLDLFVSLDLPLSITKDEEYCFTASLFSYYPEPISALLTLQRSDDYDSIYLRQNGNAVTKQKSKGHYSYLKGLVKENDIESVMYCFVPTTVGKVPVTVSVNTNIAGLSDTVQRVINVKADGTPRSTTHSFLVDLSNGQWTQEVDLAFLNETVPGSQYITVSTAGNLMGPILENLDDLLRKPYGCGEQNMLNFAPNIFLLEFYFKTGLIDETKLETARNYMFIGYTKEILYEHGKTGGYSTFGNSDDTSKNASLWLTAFVTKCFAQAEQLNSYQEVLRIDLDLISRSIIWMISQQNEDGSFSEHGRVFNKRMQGGSAQGQALTAYTMIAFHEALQVFQASGTHTATVKQLRLALSKAQAFLERRLTVTTDPYDICIVAYALHLVDSTSKNLANINMFRAATVGDGLTYWRRQDIKAETRYWWSNPNDAISVEATAYALLTIALRGEVQSQGLSVVRWLSNQRGPNGGFYSTQDTVVGLQALTSVSADMYTTEDVPLTLTVTYTDASGQSIAQSKTVSKETELLLQKIYVPFQDSYPKTIQLTGQTVSGQNAQTAVLAEVVLEYNVEGTTEAPSYIVNHQLIPDASGFSLKVDIRTSDQQPASMTILEVDIPAGFEPDTDALMEHRNVSDVEIKDDVLVVYFDTDAIDSKGVTVDVKLKFSKGVLISSKPKFLRVYNYYEPNDEVTLMFDLGKENNICAKAKSFSICPYV